MLARSKLRELNTTLHRGWGGEGRGGGVRSGLGLGLGEEEGASPADFLEDAEEVEEREHGEDGHDLGSGGADQAADQDADAHAEYVNHRDLRLALRRDVSDVVRPRGEGLVATDAVRGEQMVHKRRLISHGVARGGGGQHGHLLEGIRQRRDAQEEGGHHIGHYLESIAGSVQ